MNQRYLYDHHALRVRQIGAGLRGRHLPGVAMREEVYRPRGGEAWLAVQCSAARRACCAGCAAGLPKWRKTTADSLCSTGTGPAPWNWTVGHTY